MELVIAAVVVAAGLVVAAALFRRPTAVPAAAGAAAATQPAAAPNAGANGAGRERELEERASELRQRAAELEVRASELEQRAASLAEEREALHGDGEDRAHAPLGVALGLLLDLAQRADGVVARLVADLLDQLGARLRGAEPGDPFERALVVGAALLEQPALLLERVGLLGHAGGPLLELGRAQLELGGALAKLRGALLELALAPGRGRRLGGRRRTGRAVRRTPARAPDEDGRGDEPHRHHHRRDHSFHRFLPSGHGGPRPWILSQCWERRTGPCRARREGWAMGAARGRASGYDG